MATVLKKNCSLVGVRLVPLLKRMRSFRTAEGLTLSRMSPNQVTEDLDMAEVGKEFRALTAESLSDCLELCEREVNVANARIILHLAILYANEVGQPQGLDLRKTVLETAEASAECLLPVGDLSTPPQIRVNNREQVQLESSSNKTEELEPKSVGGNSQGELTKARSPLSPKGKCTAKKQHSCDICEKVFSKLSNLKTHMATHTTEKPYSCEVCLKRFRRSHDVTKHMVTHTGEKRFSCDICHKLFPRSSDIAPHRRIHTGEKPYSCEICHRRFTQCGSLESHKTTHSGEKVHICDLCKKGFTRASGLKSHMKVHTGEKRYCCSVCGKRFAQSSHFTSHMRSHTGEKPFSCDICQARFARSGGLARHKLIHSGEKPYLCDLCPKRFAQSYNLERHVKTHKSESHTDDPLLVQSSNGMHII